MSWLTALNLIGKAGYLVQAASNIYNTAQKEKWTTADKVDIVLQSLFAAAQVADVGIGFGASSAELKLGASIGTGVLDVSRIISNKVANKDSLSTDDYLDILGAIAFRAGDAGFTAIQTHGDSFGQYMDTVRNASTISMSVPVVIKSGQIIRNWAYGDPAAQKEAAAQNPHANAAAAAANAAAHNPPGHAAAAQPAPQPAAPPPRPPLPANVRRWMVNKNRRLQERMQNLFDVGMIVNGQIVRRQDMAAKEADEKSRDPALDEMYKKLVAEFDIPHCRMSGEPVMHCVVSSFGLNNDTLFFDRASVDRWLREKPNEAPPNWDEASAPLPLQPHYFFKSAPISQQIERAWAFLLKEFVSRASARQKENAANGE